MSNEDILNLFKNIDFEGFCDDEDKVYEMEFSFSYTYLSGVSKAVIIPDDENFVIKLPFCGMWDNYEFNLFSVPDVGILHDTDYCARELYLYHLAKKCGVSEILVKNTYIGKINDEPVYKQKYVSTFRMYYEDEFALEQDFDESVIHTDKEINAMIKSCEKTGWKYSSYDHIFNTWLVDVHNYYGEKKFVNILNFISTYLGDLHSENIGYDGDKPVILDYADFFN